MTWEACVDEIDRTVLIAAKERVRLIGTDKEHSIILHNKKRIVVCNGHCCDNHGLSEYEYYKKNRNSQPSSEAQK